MLPFTKRPARSQDSEVINTDEIEVVRTPGAKKPQSRLPHPPSERPRVFQRPLADDEEDKTLLMASKPKLGSVAPPPLPVSMSTPASMRPMPMPLPQRDGAKGPSLRGLVRRPLDDERTILRPSAAPPSATPAAQSKAPAMLPTPYMPFKPPALGKPSPASAFPAGAPRGYPLDDVMTKSAPPPPVVKSIPPPMPGKAIGSDPRLDPPAAVITARTRLSPKRSNLSWAAALLAGGVFIGLVTAVLARGDGDALLDATASFVDPSHGSGAAASRPASAGAPVVTTPAARTMAKADTKEAKKDSAAVIGACLATTDAPKDAPAPIAANTPAPKADPAPVAITSPKPEFVTLKPEPPKPPPVAYAAPPVAQKPLVAQAPAPTHAAAPLYTPPPAAPRIQPVAVAAARPAPAAPAAAAKPSSPRDDFASAAAADALAKAQLEASLR